MKNSQLVKAEKGRSAHMNQSYFGSVCNFHHHTTTICIAIADSNRTTTTCARQIQIQKTGESQTTRTRYDHDNISISLKWIETTARMHQTIPTNIQKTAKDNK